MRLFRRALVAAGVALIVLTVAVWALYREPRPPTRPEHGDVDQIVGRLAAPDGQAEALQYSTGNVSDLRQAIWIRTGHGSGAREYRAACLPDDPLKTMTWQTPTRLRLTLIDDPSVGPGGTYVVDLDPASRRPRLVAPRISCT
jgi:hypothetical protein